MAEYSAVLLKTKNMDEFKKIASLYAEDVFNVAYCILLSPAQAHNIAENTFVKAYDLIDKYDESVPLSDWFCGIAYKEAVAYSKTIDDLSEHFSAKVSFNPEQVFYHSKKNTLLDIEKDVNLALSILPLDQREVLLLHDGYGFDYDRLSYVMGESSGVLRSRTSLARTGIKNILIEKWNV